MSAQAEHEPAASRFSLARAAPPNLPLAGSLPPEQLRHLLAHYRDQGWPFDTAWERAMGHIYWPSSRRDASEWRTSMNDTREGWRASYKGWPPEPREEAVAQLDVFLRTLMA